MRRIVIANQKGGCGKTTTVVSLASSFAKLGKRVLVVDMDFQGNATGGLGQKRRAQKEKKTLTDAIRSRLKLPEVRLSTSNPKIDIVAADISLNRMAIELTGRPKQFHILQDLLDCPESQEYDICLIDTHPNLDCMLQSALVGSHYLLVPTFAEADAFEGIVFLFEEFNEIQRAFNPDLALLGLAITRFEAKNATHKKFAGLMRAWGEENNVRVFESQIPMSSAIASARSAEKSVVDQNSTLPVSEAYLALAEEILPELTPQIGVRRAGPPEIQTDVFGDDVFMDDATF